MYQQNTRLVKGADWVTIWLYIALVLIGLLSIFSVEYSTNDPVVQSLFAFKKEYSKQFVFFIACLVLGTVIVLLDSKLFTATSNLGYAFGIFLILITFVVGKEIGGSKSWIPLGPINLQPIEVAKIFTSLALAKYLSLPETNFGKLRTQLIAAAIAFSPAVLSVAQNETGAALVYFSFAVAFYREGLPTMYLAIIFAFAILIILSIIVAPNVLFWIFTIAAGLFLYANRKKLKRDKTILLVALAIWGLCIGVQKFAVPF
jgi:rod shape determining protein RodA